VNGNVKVILVGGFSVMFGFYVFMIQGVNNRIVKIGDQKSYYTEARMVATAGLNDAIYRMRDPSLWATGLSDPVKVNSLVRVGGDTASYIIERNGLPSDQARVTVIGKFGGITAKQIAVIKRVTPYTYPWNKCQIVKVYVYPYQLPAS
jgi:hypothetical protein